MADQDARVDWIEQVLGTRLPRQGELVAYRQLLLAWDGAKKQAAGQIEGFRDAVVREFPELASAAGQLDKVMLRFNDGLGDALDAALNAQNGAQRDRHRNRAGAIAQRYLVMVLSDPLFRLVDENPVTPLTVRATLSGSLKRLLGALPH